MSTLFIGTQGSMLRKMAGQYVVTRKEETLASLPGTMLECVVLLGQVQVSTQAAGSLLDDGIPLLYLSRNGNFKGMLQPGYPKNAEVRLAQYEASLDREFAVAAARSVVAAKLRSARSALRRWIQNRWLEEDGFQSALRDLEDKLPACPTAAAAMAVEAHAARIYFEAWGRAVPPPFCWSGRNRQPPQDPVNAMMSLAYMLTLGYAVAAAYAAGLDAQTGFLHQLLYGRPSFALDLLEPLRPGICDHFVLRQLQAEAWTEEDFTHSPEDGCRLTRPALGRFLESFRKQMDPARLSSPSHPLSLLTRETREAIRARRAMRWEEALEEAV